MFVICMGSRVLRCAEQEEEGNGYLIHLSGSASLLLRTFSEGVPVKGCMGFSIVYF